MIALMFQGVVTVAPAFANGQSQQQHCIGHHVQQEGCPCCPDAGAGASCTVQCSVSQAPMSIIMPARVSAQGTLTSFVDRSIPEPSYVPLVPPPIR
jgi:hypothetical protein